VKPLPAAAHDDGLFSDAYLRLRDSFLGLRRAAGAPAAATLRDAPSLNEKALRALWYEGRFERRGLTSMDGRRIAVLGAGEWNLDAGPDFLGAEVRVGDEVLRGDVEIHLTDADWRRHGHSADPAYDGVVLHVFLSAARPAFRAETSAGREVPGLSLAGRLPEPWSAVLKNFDADGYPYASHCGLGHCGRRVNVALYDRLDTLLGLAADGRVLLKAGAEADDHLFYRKLWEGMGYHRNKAAAQKAARSLPWPEVEAAAWAVSEPDRRDFLEALFLGAAGLLPESESPEWDAETLRHWERLRLFWDARPAALPVSGGRTAEWSARGVRPANHPCRRLAGLAALVASALARGRRTLLDAFSSDGPRPFVVPGEGYFARRAAWGGRPAARPVALIGPDRAQALWVNAYLPAALSTSRAAGEPEAERALRRHYRKLPLREPNGTARLMAHRLLGSEHQRHFVLRREWQQQALLQVFQDFCDTKPWACTLCVFPKVLDLSEPELRRGG
jgi:hypothetical protein